MSEVFDVTSIMNNTEDFQSFTVGVDQVMLPGISLGLLIQLMIFIVFFLSLKFRGMENAPAFATTSFITGLLTIPIRAMGILPDKWWWVGLMLIPAAIFVVFWAGKDQ